MKLINPFKNYYFISYDILDEKGQKMGYSSTLLAMYKWFPLSLNKIQESLDKQINKQASITLNCLITSVNRI